MSEQRCENCRFWSRYSDKHGGVGECRRFPPTIHPLPDEDHVMLTFSPNLVYNSWCGEWQTKNLDSPDAAG